MAENKATALWNNQIVKGALVDSMRKFDPRIQARNPVMFVVEVTALAVTVILFSNILSGHTAPVKFELQIALWLWFTVGFANFAEAMAEGRGKAQADNLRASRTQTNAKRLDSDNWRGPIEKLKYQTVLAARLLKGELVICTPGDIIPSDGE